jgi:hypothetical protein
MTRLKSIFGPLLAIALLLAVGGCRIESTKSGDGKNEKVEIKTPLGELKVQSEADPKQLGMPLYPGARLAQDNERDDDHGSMNLSLGNDEFGFKVVAIQLMSDDPVEKVLSFYRPELGKKGKVQECKGDLNIHDDNDDDKGFGDNVTCDENNSGQMELGVVTDRRMHLVSVKPRGNGSKISLVYMQARKDSETM